MKDALHMMTDDERERQMAQYRNDLANWPDMAQMDEPEEPSRWNPIAIVVLSYAAALAVVIGWIAAERMF
jgi:hypothetical protein